MHEAAEALQKFLDGTVVTPDIRGIAEDLLQELQVAPTIRADPLRGQELVVAREAIFSPQAEALEDAAHAWQALRRLGNEAFGAGLVWPAEAAYRAALEEGAGAVPSVEASLIYSNRALALLRAGHPAEAASASARALECDPQNTKAAYRRAQALLEQSRACAGSRSAVVLAKDAVEAAELATLLEPRDQKVADLLHRTRQHVEELRGAASQGADEECGSLEAMD